MGSQLFVYVLKLGTLPSIGYPCIFKNIQRCFSSPFLGCFVVSSSLSHNCRFTVEGLLADLVMMRAKYQRQLTVAKLSFSLG